MRKNLVNSKKSSTFARFFVEEQEKRPYRASGDCNRFDRIVVYARYVITNP